MRPIKEGNEITYHMLESIFVHCCNTKGRPAQVSSDTTDSEKGGEIIRRWILGPRSFLLLFRLTCSLERCADALSSLKQKGKGGAFAQYGTNAYAQQGGAMMGGGGMMMGGGAGVNGLNDIQDQVRKGSFHTSITMAFFVLLVFLCPDEHELKTWIHTCIHTYRW